MSHLVKTLVEQLLVPGGLDIALIQEILGSTAMPGVDDADLYFQAEVSESWVIEDGLVKEGSYDLDQGVGVRVISGEKTGFSYTNKLTPESLRSAAVAAKSIVKMGQSAKITPSSFQPHPSLYIADNPLDVLTAIEKVELLKYIDAQTRALDPRVCQVTVGLSGRWERILIATLDGRIIADHRPLIRLNVGVIVEHDGRREKGNDGGGARTNYQYFQEKDRAMSYAREAVRQALVNLEAKPALAGQMPVVMCAGWSGVLLHEAVGHGLEGDFNRKGTSAYAGRIGEQVASKLCTIVDDGTLPEHRGSLTIDDEGTPTQSTVLIEKGVLKGYMQDRLNARLMKQSSTGNGRRESYAHLPMPRMTNTYMLSGQHDPEEILRSVDKGIYCASLGGGQVDITNGKFVFTTNEAYMIEKGRITYPVKGATLIGDGPTVMRAISMVGNDFKMDAGVGTCGKSGQSLPVGVGQPSVRIDEITVGGTA